MDDEQFKYRHTSGCKGFSRNRTLTFRNLIFLISSVLTKSLQKELNGFFAKLSNKDYSVLEVTKGALTQARAKLKHEAFIELSNLAVNEFYNNENYRKWNGFRLLAVDGSTSNLPSHPSIKSDFGSSFTGCKQSVETSMARVSLFYDVLNFITLDATIEKSSYSENSLLNKHLELTELKRGDLLILDRGYSSNALMFELLQKGVHFCMRMRSHWHEVQDFENSNEHSRIVQFALPRKDKHLLEKYKSDNKKITCRLVAITLDTGEKEILCTSLVDNKYTVKDIGFLYHYRWNIEEAYKLLKVRMQLSNYSGKTSNAVKQDFFAKIFMMNICAIMSFPIEEKLIKENRNREMKYKVNKTNAISTLKESWVALWIKNKIKRVLIAFDDILLRAKEMIRPNRKFERKKFKYPDIKPAQPYKRI
ncbi:MAG: IS4 family transposase [Chryseotalea sp.]